MQGALSEPSPPLPLLGQRVIRNVNVTGLSYFPKQLPETSPRVILTTTLGGRTGSSGAFKGKLGPRDGLSRKFPPKGHKASEEQAGRGERVVVPSF